MRPHLNGISYFLLIINFWPLTKRSLKDRKKFGKQSEVNLAKYLLVHPIHDHFTQCLLLLLLLLPYPNLFTLCCYSSSSSRTQICFVALCVCVVLFLTTKFIPTNKIIQIPKCCSIKLRKASEQSSNLCVCVYTVHTIQSINCTFVKLNVFLYMSACMYIKIKIIILHFCPCSVSVVPYTKIRSKMVKTHNFVHYTGVGSESGSLPPLLSLSLITNRKKGLVN